MKTNSNNTYVIVEDGDGIDYLCPLNAEYSENAVSNGAFDECVEKDVVERYSANINVQTV